LPTRATSRVRSGAGRARRPASSWTEGAWRGSSAPRAAAR
jgi:hypothetical protein